MPKIQLLIKTKLWA